MSPCSKADTPLHPRKRSMPPQISQIGNAGQADPWTERLSRQLDGLLLRAGLCIARRGTWFIAEQSSSRPLLSRRCVEAAHAARQLCGHTSETIT